MHLKRLSCALLVLVSVVLASGSSLAAPADLEKRLAELQKASKYFPDDFRLRAIAVMDAPEKLDQAGIGVCGMTSALYILLKDKDKAGQDKFVSLLESIFQNKPFHGLDPSKVTVAPEVADAGYLLAYQLAQFGNKHDALIAPMTAELEKYKKDNPEGMTPEDLEKAVNEAAREARSEKLPGELDFIAARALGRLLKLYNLDLYKEQLAFSAHYELTFNDKTSTAAITRNKGYLALTVDGVRGLMEGVLGVGTAVAVSRKDGHKFGDMVQAVNEVLSDKTHKGFAMGMVAGWNTLWASAKADAGALLKKSVVDGSDIPFTHYVVITAPIETDKTDSSYYDVPVWTWSKSKVIKIKKTQIETYFYGFSYGYLDAVELSGTVSKVVENVHKSGTADKATVEIELPKAPATVKHCVLKKNPKISFTVTGKATKPGTFTAMRPEIVTDFSDKAVICTISL